jgi:RNA polymerase sigma-70 factor, ECF subfamily
LASNPERPPDAQTVACPCGHGDVPAELAGQRPLLERAAAGDREAFARLYDDQVEGVYRYLLAWTGDRAEAAELTGQVFRVALSWLTVAGGENEAGAWLIAMARDAIAQRRGPGRAAGGGGSRGAGGPMRGPAGPARPGGPAEALGPATTGAVAAVARLGDPEREVVVLRLLLGHSLAHTAHLSGYGHRAVLELQLAGCLAIRELTGGAQAGPAAPEAQPASAEELERRLGRWEVDLTGSDPVLTGALAAAASLRQAIPGHVVAPDPDLVAHLRRELVSGEPPAPTPTGAPPPPPALPGAPAPTPTPPGAAAPTPPGAPVAVTAPGPHGTHPVPGRVPRWGSVADPERGWARLSTGSGIRLPIGSGIRWPAGSGKGVLSRRPWAATGVAVAGIVLVLTLQAFGKPASPPSPTSTTAAAAAVGGSLGLPLTTVLQPTTTSTTQPAPGPAATVPRTSAATAPPTTRTASTTPPTTAPRPTTTRAPTTTAPPTTVATTTTAPPTTT